MTHSFTQRVPSPPPDLRRLLLAGMLDAVRRAVRLRHYPLTGEASGDDLRRLAGDLGRVLELLDDAGKCGDGLDGDLAEAELILDPLLDRLRLGSSLCDCDCG